MTPSEFRTVAVAILGTATGWQTGIARRLGVNPRTVRRWVAGDTPIPDRVVAELARLAGNQPSEREAVLAWLSEHILKWTDQLDLMTPGTASFQGIVMQIQVLEWVYKAIANGEHVATERRASCQ